MCIIFAWVDPCNFSKCGYLQHRHFFNLFITKQVPIVHMYISILSANSEYMPSNVCKVFGVNIEIYRMTSELHFCKNSAFKLGVYKTLNQVYIIIGKVLRYHL